MPLAVRRYSNASECSPVSALKSPLAPRVLDALLVSVDEAPKDPADQEQAGTPPVSCSDRLLPESLGALYAGSTFVGKQTNKEQSYGVRVEIKHVNLAESLVCGYLHIENLTVFCATLTTYFEGEIISGPNGKHSFLTRKWDADEAIDRQHWEKFPAFQPHVHTFNSDDFQYDPFGRDKGYLFMRWKEMFLVPDHRVESILGASFAGFYYICFDMRKQSISGLYYHEDSERFQSLELEHVGERASGSFEFR